MSLNTENKLGRYLLLFSISLFLILTVPSLFSEGMFLDGLMYASVAKNLALGQGDLWNLHYTDTFYNQFNEHPPLVYGLQSIFFRLFGDHLWVERLYSLGTYFVSSYFLFRIWLFVGQHKKTFWLPMLFLALVPLMTWSTANNMLENTMGIFTISSVYFYLRSTRSLSISAKYYYLILSSLMVLFAFLSKGFTGLYVLVFPLTYWLFDKKRNIMKGLLDSVFLTLFSALLLMTLFYFNNDAFDAILRYYERQVVGSLENVVTVKSRFYIVSKLLTELLIPIGLLLVLYFWTRKKEIQFFSNENKGVSVSFFALGLCGVLPVVISLKQSGFYIVTTFPFFALALSLIVIGAVERLQDTLFLKGIKLVKGLSYGLITVCIVLFFVSVNRVGRDKEKLSMITAFDKKIIDGQVVFIPDYMWSDWNIHAYFSRLKNVSLSTETPSTGALYLSKDLKGDDFELTLQSDSYYLYKTK